MGMGVDQPGDDEPALDIEDPCGGPDKTIDVPARSDLDDLSAIASDRFSPRLGVVRCEDLAVLNDKVGFFGLPRERARSADQEQDQNSHQDSFSHDSCILTKDHPVWQKK
jgi:hypothetical protein